jgi:alkaline phosphatase
MKLIQQLVSLAAVSGLLVTSVCAAPKVSRLTPPSDLFTFGDPTPPYIARFLPGQRFDLQATIQPDPGASIVGVRFLVDGVSVPARSRSCSPPLPACPPTPS